MRSNGVETVGTEVTIVTFRCVRRGLKVVTFRRRQGETGTRGKTQEGKAGKEGREGEEGGTDREGRKGEKERGEEERRGGERRKEERGKGKRDRDKKGERERERDPNDDLTLPSAPFPKERKREKELNSTIWRETDHKCTKAKR